MTSLFNILKQKQKHKPKQIRGNTMSNIFELIDNFQLDNIFEPIQQKFQRLTGKNCFFLARMFAGVQGALWILIAILFFVHNGVEIHPQSYILVGILNFLFVFMLLIQIINITLTMMFLKVIEEDPNKIIKKGLCNPLRLLLFKKRIEKIFSLFLNTTFFLILVGLQYIFSKFGICYTLILLFRIIEIYFISCTPLPPETSKVKQWLKNMKESLSNVFVPEPVCAPVKSYTNTNKY